VEHWVPPLIEDELLNPGLYRGYLVAYEVRQIRDGVFMITGYFEASHAEELFFGSREDFKGHIALNYQTLFWNPEQWSHINSLLRSAGLVDQRFLKPRAGG
jgi:hypothetical protein